MIDSEKNNKTQTAESTDSRIAELLAANSALEIQLRDQLLSAERRREELTRLYDELDATRVVLNAAKTELAKAGKTLEATRKTLAATKKDRDKLKKDRDKQKKRANKLQRQYSDIQASFSYRIGRVITWLPRKIRNLFSGKPRA